MKTLKLFAILVMLFVISTITASEINYEIAISEARSVDTDGEIQAVLQEYGFQVEIFEEITPEDKIKALWNQLSK